MQDYSYNFKSISHPVRIYSGVDALDSLPRELDRLGVKRALVLCGRSVHERTDLTRRVKDLCGVHIASVFPHISEGAPRQDIEQAARIAAEQGADCLIAIGAGSVTKAARVVAMLMAEKKPLEALATRYQADGLPVSTRLMAPKCPIINILTAATSSQNRGGSSLRDDDADHQLEFFDPKTRPAVIYWDAQALLSAPPSLVRAAASMEYWWGLMNVSGAVNENPLVQASRYHAYRLAQRAMPGIEDPTDWRARIDLCASSFLFTRDEDDGGAPIGGRPMHAHLITRAAYMLGVGLFNTASRINQSVALVTLTGAVIRSFGDLCPDTIVEIGKALGMDLNGRDEPELVERVAVEYERTFSRFGYTMDLRAEKIDPAQVPAIITYALRVFNCNNDGLMNDKVDRLRDVLVRVM